MVGNNFQGVENPEKKPENVRNRSPVQVETPDLPRINQRTWADTQNFSGANFSNLAPPTFEQKSDQNEYANETRDVGWGPSTNKFFWERLDYIERRFRAENKFLREKLYEVSEKLENLPKENLKAMSDAREEGMKDLSIMGNVAIRGMEYHQLRIEEEMDKKLTESLNIHATKLENVAKGCTELLSEGMREMVANVCTSKYAEIASAIQDVRTETRLNSEKQSLDLQNFQKELDKVRLTSIPELRAGLTNMILQDRADKAQIKENFEKTGKSLGILATRNRELQSQVATLEQENAQN